MHVELKAPKGEFRVVWVDLFSHEDGVKEDCSTREKALKIADDHNKKRGSSMDTVYYVYDDKGRYIRGNENVDGPGVSP